MSSIPCVQNKELRKSIEDFAEVLKTQAHTLGEHGLSEKDFYNSGLFRGAIERIRGQYSANMREKRAFLKLVLDYLEDNDYIAEWHSAGEKNRHDYTVKLSTGKTCVIELKGCLDGNNTNIFTRPAHANEFILWSVCSNPGADPVHNLWSGIHTRLSAEIIDQSQQIDGLIVWDWVCATTGRPCPKLLDRNKRITEIGPYSLPPPCIYLFPATLPSPRNNPRPLFHQIEDVEFLASIHKCFMGEATEINYVQIEAQYLENELCRKTRIIRNEQIVKESEFTPIRRA
jgi:hypothetical protein